MANLPQEIVLNITVRLPVKSILRFSPFGPDDETGTYTLDYDPSLSTLSDRVRINYPSIYKYSGILYWGTCNGLICGSPGGENYAVLWNLATREFKEVPTVPIASATKSSYCKHALGYDDEIDDFKVLSLVGFKDARFWEVQVYTLKSNSWKRLENIPYELCAGELDMAQVSVNGATHWLGLTYSEPYRVIASFDFKDERFDKMDLPSLRYADAQLCSLGGSLCLHGSTGGRTDVWEMKEYGVTESWAKLFSINHEDTVFQFSRQLVPLQFVKNGEVLLGYKTDVGYHLGLYDIKHGTSINLKDYPPRISYYATTFVYAESLVTLNSGTYVGVEDS